MMTFFKTVPHVEFMKYRKFFYALSGAMVLGTLVAVFTGGAKLSIDFTGGSLVEGFFQNPVPLEDIRKALRIRYEVSINEERKKDFDQ